MKNLTDSQRKAIKLIASNPGRVVAWQRGPRTKSYLIINGNVENALCNSGLVKQVSTGVILSTHIEDGETITSYLNTWEITEAGRKAIEFPTVAPKARRFYSPEIKRTEQSGMDSLRDMLKLY